VDPHEIASASTTGGLPVAPGLRAALGGGGAPGGARAVDRRTAFICALAIAIAIAAGLVAQLLTRLIGFFTNLAFYGRLSTASVSPADHHLGLAVVAIPVLGGIVVGLLARYGHAGIRGHGIPEAMEQILTNQSRIPARITILKPLSAAIAMGTGGPFGAEGPIIATGGALGSVVGQLIRTTAAERKALLAAGAAAGMAATFGSPVAAVLLAIELLLFEYRPRSVIPVALASAAATGVRIAFQGSAPAFVMSSAVVHPGDVALAAYVLLGALVGVVSVGVTELLYRIEDLFERLPVHWMWWPAIGGLVVGLVGLEAPRTLGVGYDNISGFLSGTLAGRALLLLGVWKFVSWAIALGSGTSGGTMAPLFTIGGALGGFLGTVAASTWPHLGIDPRIAALVGMAAMFAGASRAFLASVVLAFETTRQPIGLLPLLGGCAAAYFFSHYLAEHSIMTKKIARRGVRVVEEYGVDFLSSLSVGDLGLRPPVTLGAESSVSEVRAWLDSDTAGARHQGFPVLGSDGTLRGVITRRDLQRPAVAPDEMVGDLLKRVPIIVYADQSLREAADLMVVHAIGRLPVVSREAPGRVIGMLTRSDLLAAHGRRIDEAGRAEQSLDLRRIWAD
jgi:chloride channel protein, CIC family